MKAALDTNVLVYAEGINGQDKRDIILKLFHTVAQDACVVPVQVLGELFNVLTRKAGRSRAEAREAVLSWRDAFATVGTTPEAMMTAADLATDHAFGIWDATILAVASQSGCRLLLSEDLQDGFTWGGVTVVNPFASSRRTLLDTFLGNSAE